jgi:histidine ammonia-lyase
VATLDLDGESLDWPALRSLARGPLRLRLAPAALRRVDRARRTVDRALAAGRAVYGVNTGFGRMADVAIGPADLDALQRNLLLSHAAGLGAPIAESRLLLALRLNSLLAGHSGVSRALPEWLVRLANAGVEPEILEQGSVGASGDLAPLAQLGCFMLGLGWGRVRGRRVRAEAALRASRLEPYRFKPKEALSLVNGTSFTQALLASVLADGEELLDLADLALAMSLEALRGSVVPYDARFHQRRPHPGQLRTASNVRRHLEHSQVLASHRNCRKVQDAYSLRCAPQVHGAARDAASHAREVLLREANSPSDNPLVFESGQILSGGAFHGQALAQAADALSAALVSLANISERRIDRMTSPELSELPAFLVAESGLNSGYMMVQVAAAALTAEARADSAPASVHNIPTGASREDHVPMAPIAVRRCRRVLCLVRRVVGLEVLCAAQGLDFLAPLKPGRGVAAAHRAVRRRIPHLARDRWLRPELEALERGGVLAEALAAAGPFA